jgi:hypothetical protein
MHEGGAPPKSFGLAWIAGGAESKSTTVMERTKSMEDLKLARKLKALKQRVALIEGVANFLTKHPVISSRCVLQQMGTTVGLYFEDKARIRPVGKQTVALRLERYIDDWEPFGDDEKRLVHSDVSELSPVELAQVLRKVKIYLSKPER